MYQYVISAVLALQIVVGLSLAVWGALEHDAWALTVGVLLWVAGFVSPLVAHHLATRPEDTQSRTRGGT